MKKSVITVAILLLVVANTMEVKAGTINGSEQGIIDYVSGAVWEYEGVSYRAKPGYVNQLRGKLMSDDVDLSQKEANNAIMQINANVKKGVTDGYLEPVGGEAIPTPTENNREDEGENNITGIPQDGEQGITDIPEEEKGTITPTPYVTSVTQKEEPKITQALGEQDNQHSPTPGQPSPSKGNNEQNPNNPSKDHQKEDENPQGSYETAKRKVDIDKKISTVLNQNADTVKITMGEGKSQPVILEQYNLGSLEIITQDGEVIYQAEVPIKNTGYKVGYKRALYLGGAYIIFMIVIVLQHRKHETYDTK